MANNIVSVGQAHSINFTGRKIETDGVFGSDTQKNAIMCVQTACNLDYGAGLSIDGEYGNLSDSALSGHYVKYGETQYLVTAVEILLMLRGYDVNGVECPGHFGDGLLNAVKAYQKDNGLTVDGVAGVTTIKSLMGVSYTSSGSSSDDGAWRKYDPNNLNNFSANEFTCDCGCGGDVCDELKCKAQMLRDKIGMPMTITSGYRCRTQNAIDGGVSNSLHMYGKAFDFQVYNNGTYRMPESMINKVKELAHQCGLNVGTYYSTGFVHCQIGGSDFYGD